MRWTHALSIPAPAEVVWDLTADVEGWPRFTSTMTSVRRLDSGPLRAGSRARVKQPGQPVADWTVTAVEHRQAFSWQTSRRRRTIVGRHRVVPDGEGCRNELEVEIDGRLAWLFGPFVRYALRTENAGFAAEARRRCASA
jgi:hypothetical protein